MDINQIVDTAVSGFINKHLAKPATPPAAKPENQSLARGIVAGLIAGLIATAAKTAVEKIYPPRTHGEPEPPEVLANQVANKVSSHGLAPAQKHVAAETIHWTFGMATGAAYGALAEYYPAATAREGVNFGMTLMALTHESALPAMGLSAPAPEQTTREKTSEIASHVVYGLVTETVRKVVRKML
jgi:putative membrane protein